ncbi:MAG: hypothetical protein ABGY41_11925, partial [Candidatus Poribacteria bacterium]
DDATPRDAATLYMMGKEAQSLHVTNIVPAANVALERHGYNRILLEFCDNFARPAAEGLGLALHLTDDSYRVEDHISTTTYDELRGFSEYANRGVPHPLDMERWRRVLISLHAEGWPVDSGTIERWLVEDQGWPEGRAWELRLEVSHARDLLQDYDLRPAS